jgi:hypothetical protein
MWHSIFVLDIPVLEKIIRTVLVYATIVILFGLGGKRLASSSPAVIWWSRSSRQSRTPPRRTSSTC